MVGYAPGVNGHTTAECQQVSLRGGTLITITGFVVSFAHNATIW